MARFSTLDSLSGIPGSVDSLPFIPIPQDAHTTGGYPPYYNMAPYLLSPNQNLNGPPEQMEYMLTGPESQTPR